MDESKPKKLFEIVVYPSGPSMWRQGQFGWEEYFPAQERRYKYINFDNEQYINNQNNKHVEYNKGTGIFKFHYLNDNEIAK